MDHHYQSSPSSHRASISAGAFNIPPHHTNTSTSTTLPTSSLPPTPTSATHPNHPYFPPHPPRSTEYPTFDPRGQQVPYMQMPTEALRRQSFPTHPTHAQSDPSSNNNYYTMPPVPTHPEPQGHLPSPPEMTTDSSVSPPSLMSPSTSAIPSPFGTSSQIGGDTYPSPLQGNPNHADAVIPPMVVPPRTDHRYDDWDELPDLLRQERRADMTPRRPMNGSSLPTPKHCASLTPQPSLCT